MDACNCFVVFCLSVATNGVQGVRFNPEEVNNVMYEGFRCHSNPALAISVVKDGKVIFSRGYGTYGLDPGVTRDPDYKLKPVTPDTVFGIASLSKAFAATLMVHLLDKKGYTVNSKLKDYLGGRFKMMDDFRTQEMTFADLMSHRTAVPNHNRIRFDANLTRDNLIERLHLIEASSDKQFRVNYFYSNLMYGLVSRLSEMFGGGWASWEDLVEMHLFKPLGMTSSTFATTADFDRDDLARGYDEDREGNFSRVDPEFSRRWAEMAGSGAVMSSANDMAKWMNLHLSGGLDMNKTRVLDKDVLKAVHKPRYVITRTSSLNINIPKYPVTVSEEMYAHGFKVGFHRGYRKLTHSGSTPGYRAFMTLLPDENIGVFTVLVGDDSDYKYRFPMQQYLLDSALGLTPWINSSTLCSYPAPWAKPKEPREFVALDASLAPKKDIRQYQGTYHNEAYGNMEITYNTTLTSLVMTYGWGSWRLYPRPHLKGDKFYCQALPPVAIDISPIEFRVDKRKPSKIVSIKAEGFEKNQIPTFDKLEASKSTSAKSQKSTQAKSEKSTQAKAETKSKKMYNTVNSEKVTTATPSAAADNIPCRGVMVLLIAVLFLNR